MKKPLTEFAYDTDPKQSAQTRVKYLTTFAANRTPILAYHFAWPGVGHVAKDGDGFRYFPSGDRSARSPRICRASPATIARCVGRATPRP